MKEKNLTDWQIELRPLRPGSATAREEVEQSRGMGQLSTARLDKIDAQLEEIVWRLDGLAATVERLGLRVEQLAVSRPRSTPRKSASSTRSGPAKDEP